MVGHETQFGADFPSFFIVLLMNVLIWHLGASTFCISQSQILPKHINFSRISSQFDFLYQIYLGHLVKKYKNKPKENISKNNEDVPSENINDGFISKFQMSKYFKPTEKAEPIFFNIQTTLTEIYNKEKW